MINAPNVFAIEAGVYTPDIAVEWIKDPQLGTPTPLFIGRTLRYSDADGWEVAGANANTAWKPITQAPKTIKAAFDQVAATDPAAGYYELVGPKIAANLHGLDDVALIRHGDAAFEAPVDDIPRTSLYAWPAWLAKHQAQGVLWVDDSTGERRYAVVNAQYLPKI